MEELFEHPIAEAITNFIISHPVLWFTLFALLTIAIVLNWLARLIPQIDVVKSKILLPIAKKYKHRRLVKSAVKSDIRGHVNREIGRLQGYLPGGWAGEVDVDWVETESSSDLTEDNRIIVRVRPVDDQDQNFVNTAYYYLKSSFFPKTQAVVPKPHYEASVLHVCRQIAENRSPKTKEVFEDMILEPTIQRHNRIPNHLDDYSLIDQRGLFTGTFLRELHLMANDARFTGARNNVTAETTSILRHIKDFIEAYDSEEDMPADAWSNRGAVANYAILLVANPAKTDNGIDAYINRARLDFNSGVRRLYVFGASSERKFAEAVITAIQNTIDNVKLVEQFKTAKDYRGNKGGIGAVFEIAD